MKLMLGVLSGLLLAAPFARAQAIDEFRITVSGFAVAANGVERSAGVSFWAEPITIGKPSIGVFSMFDCGYFSVTIPGNPFKDGATGGWRVEITPVKVAADGVTFRLRWVRALDKGAGLSAANEDIELTLKPGESRPLDTVPVAAGAKTFDGRPCAMKAGSLRVSVDLRDLRELDRRLIGATVWLVEKMPNGTEVHQAQTVRGVPHRPIPFYFDSTPDGANRLDFLGTLVADLEQGGIEITLETVKARADPGQTGYQSGNWFRSKMQMKPNEIIEVALRQPEEKAGGAAGRVFSLRIQAKQIR